MNDIEGRGDICVIPGDGIGPEVIDCALLVLEALGTGLTINVLDHVNASRYRREGSALTDADIARLGASGGILLGAIGEPDLEQTDYVRSVLIRLRNTFDLYANYRPAKLLHDRLSPLRAPDKRFVDCAIVRENTEGLYSGIGGNLRTSSVHEIAIDADINTFHGVSRIMDFAYTIARREVCLVDKANAVRAGGRLWRECQQAASSSHPEVLSRTLYIDAAAMRLVTDPGTFDIIVTNNSYGDILSDLTAALVGGIGLAPSANLNSETGLGLFEPVHGSAPDIAGANLANPFAAILTTGLMLRHLGFPEEAAAVEAAVAKCVESGRSTPDLAGDLGTREAAMSVRALL